MTTKVTDSVMDLSNVQQDIAINGNKITGVVASPTLDDEASSKKYVDDQILAVLASSVPPGLGPLPWSGVTAPAGWLLCDGTSYLVATYPALFAAIGYTHGGFGLNFNVPDTRGRFVLGLNTSGSGVNRVNRTQAQNLGQISGDENVILGTSQLPSHSHSANISGSGSHVHTGAFTNFTPNHTHSTSPASSIVLTPGGGSVTGGGGGTQQANLSIAPGGGHNHSVTVPSTGSTHTHTIVIGNTPAASAHDNTPPFLTSNFIIKT